MKKQYFEEDELVQMVQSGAMGMHGYVTHHSREWDAEYAGFCEEHGLDAETESAADAFLSFKDDQLTEAHQEGEF